MDLRKEEIENVQTFPLYTPAPLLHYMFSPLSTFVSVGLNRRDKSAEVCVSFSEMYGVYLGTTPGTNLFAISQGHKHQSLHA